MIIPFRIDVADEVLQRIATRLADSRIGYAPAGGEWDYGTSAHYLAELVDHWRADYDWRLHEAQLNAFNQFICKVDGIDIHFYHIRGNGTRALPILLTHGWPGSVVEFQRVMPMLVAAGYDIVVPSLPGYGWSGLPEHPLGPAGVAALWKKLMVDELGYSRFFAQGGDWGALVSIQLALAYPEHVAAIHLNFFFGPQAHDGMDADLTRYWQAVAAVRAVESGYSYQQSTKPQTLGLALHDHPVGWASWLLEKFRSWGDTSGDIESRFPKDLFITNLMTYLVTDKVISSLWMYYGRQNEPQLEGKVTVPTALAYFPAEFMPLPAPELAARHFNLVRWTRMDAGGHFAAMEEPEAFARDVLAFFDTQ